jgi:crotonobetaine/carnitine-CoA ligase
VEDIARYLRRDACVLRYALERWARETPEAPFAVFEGERLSYAEFLKETRRRARALQELGVGQDDRVLVWLPNGPDIVKLWFAINYIGAVFVPVNTAYKGTLLEHVLENAAPKIIVVHADLAERLDSIGASSAEKSVVVGDGAGCRSSSIPTFGDDVLTAATTEVLPLARPIEPWDTQSIIYTSGTTGPSKGVLSSYAHLHYMGLGVVSNADNQPYLTAKDRFLVTSPMFHVGGTSPIYGMLALGGSFALIGFFDTHSFWRSVSDTNSTAVVLLGVMAAFLVKQQENPESVGTTLRHAFIVPLTPEAIAFGEKFGVTTYTQYSMTEISVPLKSDADPRRPGYCGRPRAGMELRIVDGHDFEAPSGQVGELVLRTSQPWLLSHGYNNDPEATARCWRNGWFHTGDGFRQDEDGSFFFVDRFKDAIRRRGENISSFEVEVEVGKFPSVRECAAVAVPGESGEDEVLINIAPVQGANIDLVALIAFLEQRMPYFMVPRYVRLHSELPKTPTGKVEKFALRAQGVTEDVWDRERAGIKLRRERFKNEGAKPRT